MRDLVSRTMAAIAILLAVTLGAIAIRASATSTTAVNNAAVANDTANQATDAVNRLTDRRAVTVDALNAYQRQRECENETFGRFDGAVADVILAEPRSVEQAAAIERLAPIREDLRAIKQRCIDPNPLPSTDPPPPNR
jgi:hypothetical protein